MSRLADYLWQPAGLPWPGGLRGRLCNGRWYHPDCKDCDNRWWFAGQPGFFAPPKPPKHCNWGYICTDCGLQLALSEKGQS